MTTQPPILPLWTSGPGENNALPPAELMASGWAKDERPAVEYVNWLQWSVGQWLQHLLQQSGSLAQTAALDPSIRLLGGGLWGWDAASSTLSWSDTFYLSCASLSDSVNAVAAGSVQLSSSANLAYCQSNVPFAAQGSIASGGSVLELASNAGSVQTGMSVTGPGLGSGVKVTSLDEDGSPVLSSAATSAQTDQTYTFFNTSPVMVQTANNGQFVPTIPTVVIARVFDGQIVLGANSGQMLIRNGEQKPLLDAGFVQTVKAKAGQALAKNTPVYISSGADDGGRTAGAMYPCEASSTSSLRTALAGVTPVAYSQGDTVSAVVLGVVNSFTGLIPGHLYYVDPTSPGGLTPNKPAVSNQYIVSVGMALSTTTLTIAGGAASAVSQVTSGSAWPNYAASSEASLSAALAGCANFGGGVVVVFGSFSLTSGYTVPANTIMLGRRGSSVITVTGAQGFTLQDGAELRELAITSSAATTLVTMAGNFAMLRGCQLSVPPASASTCARVTGNSNRLSQNQFSGVMAAGSTSNGIVYASGVNNADDNSIFLS